MSKTFKPRDVGPGAWKTWHKDSLRTLGRLGPINMGILCAVAAGLSILAGRISEEGLLFVAVAPLMQCVGVIFMILAQHLVSQSAEEGRASLIRAIASAWMEIQANPGWVARRFLGQLGAAALFFLFMTLVLLMALAGQNGDAPEPSAAPTLIERAQTMMIFLAAFPSILQRKGSMSFSYWLGLKHGMSPQMVNHYCEMASDKNPHALSFASMSVLLSYMFFGLSPFALFSFLFLPVFLVYHAAYTRCAYHDIFEDGTGLKEKKKAEEDVSNMVPVLQA